MLLHIDASKHAWFQDGRYYDLITILDDATSDIYYAQLVFEEGTRTLMPAIRKVVEQRGVFCALYSDQASHFFDAKSGRPGGSAAGELTWAGVAGSGQSDDSGVFAAGSGAHGAELPHLARQIAARVAPPRDCRCGSGEPVCAGRICGGIQPALRGSGGGERDGVRVRDLYAICTRRVLFWAFWGVWANAESATYVFSVGTGGSSPPLRTIATSFMGAPAVEGTQKVRHRPRIIYQKSITYDCGRKRVARLCTLATAAANAGSPAWVISSARAGRQACPHASPRYLTAPGPPR